MVTGTDDSAKRDQPRESLGAVTASSGISGVFNKLTFGLFGGGGQSKASKTEDQKNSIGEVNLHRTVS